MNKIYLICCLILLSIGTTFAQGRKPSNDASFPKEKTHSRETKREYSIIVYERQSNSPLSFAKEIATQSERQGFWANIFDTYRSNFSGKVTNLSSNIIGTGVDLLVKSFTKKKDNHQNWRATVQREMTYSRKLPMQTEIADFYRNTSSVGAMDPEGMMFDGLGCRQYLTYRDENGIQKRILVFEVSCSLDDSKRGKERILHHGKFEIKVDSIKFNPYLCDLPNDSLTEDQVNAALRIPFDFSKRKNLTFKLTASISSSWMNESIEIFKDQSLGQFQVQFTIPDSTLLNTGGNWKGYFTYDSTSLKDQSNPQKDIMVTGECFIVPRSFIGNYANDETLKIASTPIWGTGQYRIDMEIAETCQINEQYYTSDDKWKEEWKVIKKRKPSTTILDNFAEQAKNEFDMANHKWIYTILDPVKSAIVIDETLWINQIINIEENKMPTGSSQASGKQQNGSDGGKTGLGGQNNPGRP